MLCLISLTQSKRREQIPISITPQNAGCKVTREEDSLVLRGLWDIYTHLFQLQVIHLRRSRGTVGNAWPDPAALRLPLPRVGLPWLLLGPSAWIKECQARGSCPLRCWAPLQPDMENEKDAKALCDVPRCPTKVASREDHSCQPTTPLKHLTTCLLFLKMKDFWLNMEFFKPPASATEHCGCSRTENNLQWLHLGFPWRWLLLRVAEHTYLRAGPRTQPAAARRRWHPSGDNYKPPRGVWYFPHV